MKFQRDLASHNRGDRWQPLELASALYVQALTDQSKRTALLHVAAGRIEALPPEIRVLQDVQWWRARILEAPQRAGITTAGPDASSAMP